MHSMGADHASKQCASIHLAMKRMTRLHRESELQHELGATRVERHCTKLYQH